MNGKLGEMDQQEQNKASQADHLSPVCASSPMHDSPDNHYFPCGYTICSQQKNGAMQKNRVSSLPLSAIKSRTQESTANNMHPIHFCRPPLSIPHSKSGNS